MKKVTRKKVTLDDIMQKLEKMSELPPEEIDKINMERIAEEHSLIRCINCGNEISTSLKFCVHCGCSMETILEDELKILRKKRNDELKFVKAELEKMHVRTRKIKEIEERKRTGSKNEKLFSEIRKDIKILSNMIQDEEICFDFIARDKDIPGFVVGYIDQKRDIRINVELDIESFEKGKAKSEIFFKNINKRLNLSGDFYDLYLSKKLPYDVYREFQEWKRLKLIVRENNYHNNNYYTRHSAKTGTCIYCNGTIMSGQTCCYSCRQKYEKHRNIGGGYPSYDPNTKGSNSNW